jgi:hypothetical protein
MSNREKLITRLSNISDKLKAEVDYYMNDVEHEEIPDYDLANAFEDYVDLVLQGKTPPIEVRRIYIDIGYAIETDITKVQVNSGSKFWFKHVDKHYQCVSGWEDWVKK